MYVTLPYILFGDRENIFLKWLFQLFVAFVSTTCIRILVSPVKWLLHFINLLSKYWCCHHFTQQQRLSLYMPVILAQWRHICKPGTYVPRLLFTMGQIPWKASHYLNQIITSDCYKSLQTCIYDIMVVIAFVHILVIKWSDGSVGSYSLTNFPWNLFEFRHPKCVVCLYALNKHMQVARWYSRWP